MISNELLDEIIFLSSKGIIINQRILEKIFYQMYNFLDIKTQQSFNDLQFRKIDKKMNCRAICLPTEGEIIVDLDAIYKEEVRYGRTKKLSLLSQNINIIYTLLHEIEHLKEPSKICKNNFEGKLLSCSQIDDINLQHSVYDTDPSEKIAYVDAYKVLLDILKNYPNFIDKYFLEYKYINNKYVQSAKLGYYYDEFLGKYNVPLIDFLRDTNQLEKLSNLFVVRKVDTSIESSVSKLDVTTKMKYGLSITKKDIRELDKQKILTRGTK